MTTGLVGLVALRRLDPSAPFRSVPFGTLDWVDVGDFSMGFLLIWSDGVVVDSLGCGWIFNI